MKTFFVALMMVLMVQGVSYADEDAGGKDKFKQMKEGKLKNIGKRITLLKDFRSCVTSADSREDMKSCEKEKKKKMESLKAEKKEKRKEMKKKKKHQKEED